MPLPNYTSSGQSDDVGPQKYNLLISTRREYIIQTESCLYKNQAMDEQGNGRVSIILQIVRLKELVRKWHNATVKSAQSNSNSNQHGHSHSQPGGIAPEVCKRLKKSAVGFDSDEDGCQSPEPPPDVPKGYLAVYVGPVLRRRFIIPTSYLTHHLFKVLLEKAEEEFGYEHGGGGITIPCDIEIFKYLIKCIESENINERERPTEAVDESAK
ncbi:uncharacterized protein [Spinacia oleracea]|uniref:Uncharacterized protein n=1 Tax=Spinacia oleracea TaxID=3562 RepID=A0A9R0IH16_SPIOL|nr:uncharacterized protein LOC110788867 [Spinacia oleracea]